MAERIKELLDNPSQRLLMARNAEKRYWEKYSKDVVVKMYETLYADILN